MSKPIAVYAALTLALTSSAFAYTYTCQEGHFQIEVPEEWEVAGCGGDLNRGQLLLTYESGDTTCMMEVSWCPSTSTSWENWISSQYRKQGFSLKGLHDSLVNNMDTNSKVTMDKFLTQTETVAMNIDSGFILLATDEFQIVGFSAYFVKGVTVYRLVSGNSTKLKGYTSIKTAIIKSFNSFHALN